MLVGAFGETVATGDHSADAAVQMWYSGEAAYPYSAGEPDLADVSQWGYFTQLVWKSNMRVGCSWSAAWSGCSHATWVCHFSPGGNYLGSFQTNVERPGQCFRFSGCIYPVVGCMSPTAANYDPNATTQDGATCLYPVRGCTDSAAVNFLPAATLDDGSCKPRIPDVTGCMDQSAANYDSTATVQGGCRYVVRGCTDSTALNYLSSAVMNEGCTFAICAPVSCSPPAPQAYTLTTILRYLVAGVYNRILIVFD